MDSRSIPGSRDGAFLLQRTRAPGLMRFRGLGWEQLNYMQVTDRPGLGIHFRGDSVGFPANRVTLRFQCEHSLVKLAGTPCPNENRVAHRATLA
jgi:hypothetical protein